MRAYDPKYGDRLIQLYKFSKTDQPAAAEDGLIAFCVDDIGGAVLVYSLSGAWKRCTDGATIS